jgi:excisionase family DNA binding protein
MDAAERGTVQQTEGTVQQTEGTVQQTGRVPHQRGRTTDALRAEATEARWLNIVQVAKMTGYSRDTILRERELGRLHGSQPTGRGWRFELREVERWMSNGSA